MPIKLVASDLDGTLVDHNNFIPFNNLKAIQTMNEQNINFAICTGKTYAITKDICDKCHASYGIFGNGTQIVNLKTGEEIYKNLVPMEAFDTCHAIAKKQGLHLHVYSEKEIISEELKYMDLRNFVLHGKEYVSNNLSFTIVPDIKNYMRINTPQIFKLVLSSESGLDRIREEIMTSLDLNVTLITKRGNYRDKIIDKEYEYLDITPKNIGKGYALHYLTNLLNVSTEEVMAIGDNVNDIDMLQTSGIGVTLADSYEEVKRVANYITTNTSTNSGFAEAVYKFIS